MFALWILSSRASSSPTFGIVVKFESLEKSFASAATETDVGLGWNGTSGGSKSSSLIIKLSPTSSEGSSVITNSSSMRSSRSISVANILRMNRPR